MDKRDILYHVFDQVSDILCGIIVVNKLIIVPTINHYNLGFLEKAFGKLYLAFKYN